MRAFPIVGLALLTGVLAAGQTGAVVKIHLTRGHPLVDGVYLNGHGPYRFLIDTGSTSNHLEQKLARSIGLTPTLRTELASSAGVTVVSGNDGIEVALGPVRAGAQTFLFAGLEAVHQLSPDIQGVLGQAFLSRFDYRLDLRGQRLEFGTVEFDGKAIRVPFLKSNDRPLVNTSLGPFLLDSGADGVIVFGAGGGDVKYEMTTMSGSFIVGTITTKLLIDGRRFWHGEAVAVPRQEDVGVAGLLPISLFRSVYICNSEGYVVFE
ncbi:MAG: retroviral-like aspartic protease family protein [Acidobacteriia bacterium]|nr:retroviral-like aspartic protease family protein [Terriglobia bacterium]